MIISARDWFRRQAWSHLKNHTVALALACLHGIAAQSQEELPVLKANSTTVKIIDGSNAPRGDWILDPSVVCDVYYAIRSDKKRTITFKSDLEAKSFEVEPGQLYDFVIMLHGKDACKTQISTMVRGFERVDKTSAKTPLAIPIAMEHGKLHVKGSVNGSKNLDLIFDTGADTCVIYPSAMTKGVKLTLDDSILSSGTGGMTQRQVSRKNQIEIADARWTHESIIYVEKQADRADGIVGYNLFEDRIVEIDYDRMLMLVHDSLPSDIGDYAKTPMPFSGSLPAVEVVMTDGRNSYRGPFILDTAGNGCMLVNQAFAKEHNMHGTLRKVGTGVSRGVGTRSIQSNQLMVPALSIAGHSLRDVPLHAEVPTDSNQAPPGGVVCMEVLSRFNTVLDFPANEAYFKPNARFGKPFPIRGSRTSSLIIVATIALASFATTAIWYLRRKRKK